jgi:hypothetical protein
MHRLTVTQRGGLLAPFPRRRPALLPPDLIAGSGGGGPAPAFPWPKSVTRRRSSAVRRRMAVARLPLFALAIGSSNVLFSRGHSKRSRYVTRSRSRVMHRLLWDPRCCDPADCASLTRSGAAAAALRHNSSGTSSSGTATFVRAEPASAAFYRKRHC